jgi:hypothetical protein
VNLNNVFVLRMVHAALVLWALDIIILGTPRGDLIDVSSSSYNLSIFSSKAGSHNDGGIGATRRESSSVSIGDLWPEVDSLCGAEREETFASAV